VQETKDLVGKDLIGALDLRRKAQIAWAKPSDHAGEVVVARNDSFDLDKTIFQSLDTALPRIAMRGRLAVELFWSDAIATKINESFSSIPRAIPHDQALLDFMRDDCNFSMEHADGSFMDHLQFCYEYSTAHFPGQSPRVLLLHSILGVGTNYFPMEVSKVPKMQAMLTEDEFLHVEAFPSMLRLILSWEFLDEMLDSTSEKLSTLKSIDFHRVIDNKPLCLTADQLWVQLNYQLVHLLDFLPVANWSEMGPNDNFFQPFRAIHKLLEREGKLMAHVDFELTDRCEKSSRPPVNLGTMMMRFGPTKLIKRIGVKSIARFSDKIGHSLAYKTQYEERPKL